MSDKTKRRFQFHLSTAVMSVLAIGALLLANTATQEQVRWLPRMCVNLVGSRIYGANGWPYTVCLKNADGSQTWYSECVIANVLVAAVVLAVVARGSEFLIRRREARKT